MTIFSWQNEGASEFQLRSFERRRELRLPDAYRQFLRKHDGGVPFSELIPFCGAQRFVGLFLGVGDGSIERAMSHFPSSRPLRVLPIAQGGGNLFLLDSDGGAVRFWHHEDEYPESLHELPVGAGSFAGFVSLFGLAVVESDAVLEMADAAVLPPDAASRIRALGGPDARSKKGYTLAQEAVRRGNLSLLKIALSLGAARTELLHIAASNDRVEIIEWLVREGGFSLEEKDSRGRTPVERAIFPGSKACLLALSK